MTEKRFKYGSNERWECVLIDTLEKKEYDFCEVGKLCNKLWEQTQRFEKHNKDLTEENEQLKSSDTITDLETEIMKLKKENEQLKKDVEYWKQVASQYSNELNVFEHCKKYKTECKDIHIAWKRCDVE